MRENPRPQEIYKHFKGNLYQILSLAEHTETGEMLVVYQALYGEFKVYARELSMFLSETDMEKYPAATQKYRFEKVERSCMGTRTEAAQEELELTQESTVRAACNEKQPAAAIQVNTVVKESTQTEQNTEIEEAEEELHIDPFVMEFLDADSYEERLNILAALQGRITNEMINTMAVSVDLEINDGSVEERYDALKSCLLMLEKYECNRLR